MEPGNQGCMGQRLAKCLFLVGYRICVSHLWKYPVSEIKVSSEHILREARCLEKDSNQVGNESL